METDDEGGDEGDGKGTATENENPGVLHRLGQTLASPFVRLYRGETN